MAVDSISGRLVGREPEIARLHEWVLRCAAGNGRAVLIEGEPGIGKSTLLDAACAAAVSAGLTVLRGGGDELGRALPLLPLLDALGVRRATRPNERGGPDLHDRRAMALRLLRGELVLGGGVDVVAAAAEQLYAVVDEAVAAGPTLLAIDDLQWADTATVALWARLAATAEQHALLLVGVARPTPHRDGVRALRRTVRAEHLLRLDPLGEPAVAALLTSLAGAAAGPRLSRLAHGAAGNPLYLTELVGALARGARLVEQAPGVLEVVAGPAPQTLSAAIADRLGFLPEPVRDVLRAAALLGVDFAVEDLAAVLRRSVPDLLPALDDAITAGVLTDAPHGLRFRHPLIHTALYEERPAALRAAWHRDAGRALAEAGAPVDRVARQLLSAHSPDGAAAVDGWALDWLVAAGPVLAAQAPKAAVELLRGALGAAAARGDQVYATLASHLARTLYRMGDSAEAERVASAAVGRVSDPDLVTELHWTMAEVRTSAGRIAESLEGLRAALALPGLTDRHRARLRVRMAAAYRNNGQIELSAKASAQALEEAYAAGDEVAVGWALHLNVTILVMHGEVAGVLDMFDQALAVTADHPRLADLRMLVQVNRTVILADLDRFPESIAQGREVLRQATEAGSVVRMSQATSALGEVQYDAGAWDDALVAAQMLADELKDKGVACSDRGVAAQVLLHRGETEAARQHVIAGEPHAALLGARLVAAYVLARALLAEHDGRPRDALAILTAGLGSAGANVPPQESATDELDEVSDLLADAARLAGACAEPDVAERVATLAERLRAEAPDVPHRAAAAAYCRGLPDRDPALLRGAADLYRLAGRPLLRAAALEAAALASAAAGDDAAARAAFTEALDVYGDLGAVWDAARLQSGMRAHGIRRAPRVKHRAERQGWQSLTPAELKVAELVTRGMSNPQIAARLYLSPRTVATHVSHILAKLSLHSRTDLAREATRRRPS